MDKDRVVGSAKVVKGKIKEAVGKAVGDAKLESRATPTRSRQGSERRRRPQRHSQTEIGIAATRARSYLSLQQFRASPMPVRCLVAAPVGNHQLAGHFPWCSLRKSDLTEAARP
jgi:hypothetical protein